MGGKRASPLTLTNRLRFVTPHAVLAIARYAWGEQPSPPLKKN